MSKFKNIPQSVDGYSFSSGLETNVYLFLKTRVQSGEIKEIQVQDHVKVCCPFPHEKCNFKKKIEYIADFKCTPHVGDVFWVEAKGFPNERWPMKRRLWMHNGPGKLEIYVGHKNNFTLKEILEP